MGGGRRRFDCVRLHLDLTECPRTFIPDIDRLADEHRSAVSVVSETSNPESIEMRPDRKERAAEDTHEEEEEEVMKKINACSLIYFFQNTNSYKKKEQMSHPPLISRFANDAIVF